MPATINHNPQEKFLELRLTGKLTEQDYNQFGPQIESLIREHGKLRILCEMHDFHGWTFGGLWADVKFDVKHFNDVERLALVGEKRWQEAMAAFCKPFTSAKIRYFERFEIDDARQWLTKESPETVQAGQSFPTPTTNG
ncbi:MAG: STAS/SEC14 domain-containing protein [Planctomycetota bacterium]|nr:MAG: STAS/SEC14 domain-containing protein [Planctomycetota bacterium]REJ94956.1 MAG: STAS/SEC14 domain-containing protein [Planctomycetota bacterium]REK20000.1 MAG: STAS/SEC14 domain-containing protein [Planctomycetota bacterium]REK27567.1 MAG: STAS/SEC14 domain-containing protein [Planctomycetota bacterium]